MRLMLLTSQQAGPSVLQFAKRRGAAALQTSYIGMPLIDQILAYIRLELLKKSPYPFAVYCYISKLVFHVNRAAGPFTINNSELNKIPQSVLNGCLETSN